MEQKLWTPSDYDKELASQGYIQYSLGLSILQKPEKFNDLHGEELINEASSARVYSHAHGLMINGLKRVTRFANPAEIRSNLSKMEENFDSALPNILGTIDYTFDHLDEQMDAINSCLKIVKPMPIIDKITYGFLCHSRMDKLTASSLMGGFLMKQIFETNEK